MARGRENTAPDTADATGQPSTGARRVRPAKRARLGVVLLTVLVSELVLIGAGLNQAVSKHLDTFEGRHHGFPGQIARSLLILRWSFSPQHHESDLWHAELITIGLTVLFSVILVALVVHGPITWVQSFVGTWLAVTVATVVAAVTALVLADLEQSADFAYYAVPGSGSTHLSESEQFQQAIFGSFLPYDFVAGLALGLVVGLLVALVAVSTRRTDPAPVAVVPQQAPASAPDAPQPFFGDEAAATRSAYGTARYSDTHPYASPDRRAESETTTFPAFGSGYTPAPPDASNDTAALPRVGTDAPPAPAESAAPPASVAPAEARPAEAEGDSTQAWPVQPESGGDARSEGEPTAAFPRPPDDDDLDRDLGHHDD